MPLAFLAGKQVFWRQKQKPKLDYFIFGVSELLTTLEILGLHQLKEK